MFRILAALVACVVLGGCTPVNHLAIAQTVAQPPCPPEDVAALPAGSRVEISAATGDAHQSGVTFGTVLKAGPEGVALMNCEVACRSESGVPVLSKSPFTSRLFKNTGVAREQIPVLWIPAHRILATHVIAPPPAGYVPPQLEIDTATRPMYERIGVSFDYAEATANE